MTCKDVYQTASVMLRRGCNPIAYVAKTEVLWCSSVRRQHQIPTTPIMVGTTAVTPVRDLGIYIDSGLTMQAYIAKTVPNCFAVLRHIRSIRRSVTKPVLLAVTRRLNGVDASGLRKCDSCRPAQYVTQSTAVCAACLARLIYSARKYDHVTSLLRDLHWLRVPERTVYV